MTRRRFRTALPYLFIALLLAGAVTALTIPTVAALPFIA